MILPFLKLIRIKNLGIIAFCQILFKYFFFNKSGVDVQLTNFYFILLLLSLLFLAAAGYIINDVYDLESDIINKPKEVIIGVKISERLAIKIYIFFNLIGLGLAYYLSYAINHLNYALLFLGLAFGLLKYSQSWKDVFILKNVLVAFLVSSSVLILGVYDLLPPINATNKLQQLVVISIVFDYFIFAFLLNLIREIIKDIEDEIGDKKRKTKSFISALGIKKTRLIILFLNIFLIAFISFYTIKYFTFKPLAFTYMISLVLIPSVVYFILFIKAKTLKNYSNLTSILKLIMIFGVGSIAIISILNN